MRPIIVILVSLLLVGSAAADWTTPGWYVVVGSLAGDSVGDGPFNDEESCRTKLKGADDFSADECEYLAERPDLDGKPD